MNYISIIIITAAIIKTAKPNSKNYNNKHENRKMRG